MYSTATLLPSIILSDVAILEAGTAKPSLIGVFHVFNIQVFPSQVARFFVTVSLTDFQPDVRSLKVECLLKGTESEILGRSGAQVELGESPTSSPGLSFDISFPFIGVVFQNSGFHSVEIFLEDAILGRRSFLVNAIASTEPSA